MKGKRTDPKLVDEIRQLRRAHRPAEIVRFVGCGDVYPGGKLAHK